MIYTMIYSFVEASECKSSRKQNWAFFLIAQILFSHWLFITPGANAIFIQFTVYLDNPISFVNAIISASVGSPLPFIIVV